MMTARQQRGAELLRMFGRAKRLGLIQTRTSALLSEESDSLTDLSLEEARARREISLNKKNLQCEGLSVLSEDISMTKCEVKGKEEVVEKESQKPSAVSKKRSLRSSEGCESAFQSDSLSLKEVSDISVNEKGEQKTPQEYFDIVSELAKERQANFYLRKKNAHLQQLLEYYHRKEEKSRSLIDSTWNGNMVGSPVEKEVPTPSLREGLSDNMVVREKWTPLLSSTMSNNRTERRLHLSHGYVKLLLKENRKLRHLLASEEKSSVGFIE